MVPIYYILQGSELNSRTLHGRRIEQTNASCPEFHICVHAHTHPPPHKYIKRNTTKTSPKFRTKNEFRKFISMLAFYKLKPQQPTLNVF